MNHTICKVGDRYKGFIAVPELQHSESCAGCVFGAPNAKCTELLVDCYTHKIIFMTPEDAVTRKLIGERTS